ncbi:MAG: STAS domain-containing protein [Bacteroidota bacterium]
MLKISREGKNCRVELFQVNRLNTLFSGLVKQQLQELLEEQGTSVVFDLDGIRFIDTAGFEVLQNITDWASQHGSEFKLCNVTDDVKELIILLELEGNLAFCTCANVEEKILLVLD